MTFFPNAISEPSAISRLGWWGRRLAPRGGTIAAAALVLLSLGSGARAGEALVPGTTTWALTYETGERFCLAHAFFPRSGVVMGFVSDGVQLGIGMVNDAWRLGEWQDYKITLRFDGGQPLDVRFTATDPSAIAMQLDADVEDAFRHADVVDVIGAGGRAMGRFNLKGSARAIDYVRTCGQLAGMHPERDAMIYE